jgi:hypothetical protein
MGEYFHYVNHDKEMRFYIDAFGGSVRFDGVGFGLGARAFCLLLTKSNDRGKKYKRTWMGTWSGDRVSCMGDHGKLGDIYTHYKDVTANVLIMLYEVDGPEILMKNAKRDDELFLQIVYLYYAQKLPGIQEYIEMSFGEDWEKRYETLLEKNQFTCLHNTI